LIPVVILIVGGSLQKEKRAMNRNMGICILSVMLAAVVGGCSGMKSDGTALASEPLAGCPDRPNCVSSQSQDPEHAISPMHLKGEDRTVGWNAVRGVVGSLSRCTLVKATDDYLHAECRSRLFGFVDDLEFQLDPVTGVIAVRSAARVGYSDFGVNRRRVEALRKKLRGKGVIY
jgi:uncharacterized protein (DUF1499 family)